VILIITYQNATHACVIDRMISFDGQRLLRCSVGRDAAKQSMAGVQSCAVRCESPGDHIFSISSILPCRLFFFDPTMIE
jgi:hypothetical protein